MQKFIEVKNLIKKYGDKEILKNISFDIFKGDFISIIGESGVGKSTLIKCLNGLEKISSGSIKIDDVDINLSSEKEKNILKRRMALVFQDLNIIDNLPVIENVLLSFLPEKNFFQILFNLYSKKEYERALYCLEKVGLKDLAYKKAKYLSGGEKQRVVIARSLAPNVDLILGDELISNLDLKNTFQIMEILKKINQKKNKTIILNLHNVEIAKKYSDKILALRDGKVLFFKESEKVDENDIREVYKNTKI